MTKEAYTNPETATIAIRPMKNVLDVSNPSGDVPPIDPNEE